jgi:hypothetical protein
MITKEEYQEFDDFIVNNYPTEKDYIELEQFILGLSYFNPDVVNIPSCWIPEIPLCCKDCLNHPINGGTGICNCTLPSLTNGQTLTTNATGPIWIELSDSGWLRSTSNTDATKASRKYK